LNLPDYDRLAEVYERGDSIMMAYMNQPFQYLPPDESLDDEDEDHSRAGVKPAVERSSSLDHTDVDSDDDIDEKEDITRIVADNMDDLFEHSPRISSEQSQSQSQSPSYSPMPQSPRHGSSVEPPPPLKGKAKMQALLANKKANDLANGSGGRSPRASLSDQQLTSSTLSNFSPSSYSGSSSANTSPLPVELNSTLSFPSSPVKSPRRRLMAVDSCDQLLRKMKEESDSMNHSPLQSQQSQQTLRSKALVALQEDDDDSVGVITGSEFDSLSANSRLGQSPVQQLQAQARKDTKGIQEYLPYSLSAADALSLTMLISQQEATYGVNMFESMTKEEQIHADRLCEKEGIKYEDAALKLFEIKFGINTNTNINANIEECAVPISSQSNTPRFSSLLSGNLLTMPEPLNMSSLTISIDTSSGYGSKSTSPKSLTPQHRRKAAGIPSMESIRASPHCSPRHAYSTDASADCSSEISGSGLVRPIMAQRSLGGLMLGSNLLIPAPIEIPAISTAPASEGSSYTPTGKSTPTGVSPRGRHRRPGYTSPSAVFYNNKLHVDVNNGGGDSGDSGDSNNGTHVAMLFSPTLQLQQQAIEAHNLMHQQTQSSLQ
jgi:hypothetical protein